MWRSADRPLPYRCSMPWKFWAATFPAPACATPSLCWANPNRRKRNSGSNSFWSRKIRMERRNKMEGMSKPNLVDEAEKTAPVPASPPNFLRDIIAADLKSGKYKHVQTRFPPEPNGYLHIGHAKAICLDFGLADEFGGRTNLRFDDTNPEKEEQEYVDSIQTDVHWLGFDWERLCYASDYFGQLYEWALKLIQAGKAYVDDLSAEEIRQHRGTLTEPGKDSPYRNRSVEENLDLFTRMKRGEFPDGSRVLRAKIDMGSPNLNMRDPVMYRIVHATHHRTGDEWCIYPIRSEEH